MTANWRYQVMSANGSLFHCSSALVGNWFRLLGFRFFSWSNVFVVDHKPWPVARMTDLLFVGKFDSPCHPVVFTDGKCRSKFGQLAWKAHSRRSLANEQHKVRKFPLLDVEGGAFNPEVT